MRKFIFAVGLESEHLTKGRKRTKATMVVAQICTEDIRMKGCNFEYLTNTTTWLREVGLEPTTFRV